MKRGSRWTLLMGMLAAVAAARPEVLLACSVCFGASDSPTATALNWSVFALLVVIVSVLVTIATFFVYLARRSAAMAANAAGEHALPEPNQKI